jgi:hypothetical protein
MNVFRFALFLFTATFGQKDSLIFPFVEELLLSSSPSWFDTLTPATFKPPYKSFCWFLFFVEKKLNNNLRIVNHAVGFAFRNRAGRGETNFYVFTHTPD